MCQLVEKNVQAVLGVELGSMDQNVASILNYLGLPLVQVNPSHLWSVQKTQYGSSVNLFPDRKTLSQVRLSIKLSSSFSSLW